MAVTANPAPVIALVGNPNVGKSTVFNALTNLHQHTGNWPGKTVATARGLYTYHGRTYTLVDLPGTYSLHPSSAEEEVTRDYLLSGEADVTLVVVDATCLERNLALVLQVLERVWPVVVCVNLLDEAAKKGIQVDLSTLRSRLGVPVVGAAARSGQGLEQLRQSLEEAAANPPPRPLEAAGCAGCPGCEECQAASTVARAVRLAGEVMSMDQEAAHRRDRAIDRLLTSRATGIPVMLLLLGAVLWLTMAGANLPSQLLSQLLMGWQEPLRGLFHALGAPWWLEGALVDGMYRTVAWVVSVMLPPMAIFFPLFTLLEDAGYLPRVAFNLDHFFQRSGAHGRQALTMCMGLGCNACGVMGCRIIQSPRERLIAILTNAFVPCNGRLPPPEKGQLWAPSGPIRRIPLLQPAQKLLQLLQLPPGRQARPAQPPLDHLPVKGADPGLQRRPVPLPVHQYVPGIVFSHRHPSGFSLCAGAAAETEWTKKRRALQALRPHYRRPACRGARIRALSRDTSGTVSTIPTDPATPRINSMTMASVLATWSRG